METEQLLKAIDKFKAEKTATLDEFFELCKNASAAFDGFIEKKKDMRKASIKMREVMTRTAYVDKISLNENDLIFLYRILSIEKISFPTFNYQYENEVLANQDKYNKPVFLLGNKKDYYAQLLEDAINECNYNFFILDEFKNFLKNIHFQADFPGLNEKDILDFLSSKNIKANIREVNYDFAEYVQIYKAWEKKKEIFGKYLSISSFVEKKVKETLPKTNINFSGTGLIVDTTKKRNLDLLRTVRELINLDEMTYLSSYLNSLKMPKVDKILYFNSDTQTQERVRKGIEDCLKNHKDYILGDFSYRLDPRENIVKQYLEHQKLFDEKIHTLYYAAK